MNTEMCFESYLWNNIEDFQDILFYIEDNCAHLLSQPITSRSVALMLYRGKEQKTIENMDYLDKEANEHSISLDELSDENCFCDTNNKIETKERPKCDTESQNAFSKKA